jgi:hypothetical protein
MKTTMNPPCFAFAAACGIAAAISTVEAHAQSDDPPTESEASPGAPAKDVATLLSAQAFWAQGKVMPGAALGLRFGAVELDLEAALLWLTEPAPPRGLTFLGNQIGAHLMFLPVRERYFDLGVGLGGDFYWLWNVHGDAFEPALALKAEGNLWLTPQLAVYAAARAYPWKSSGLELGTTRGSEDELPVLFSTGITWRL